MVVAIRPKSNKLVHVAEWYMERLPAEQQVKLKEAVAAACAEGRALRVGSMCSGTDSPIVVMKKLATALKNKLRVEHTFSCEFDPRKREWIKENFPELKLLFGDVNELKSGQATNWLTEELVKVPKVDVVIAGFVCKSVSSENNEREQFANCIEEACGKTGETFDGVIGYVNKYKPSIVICENVRGLVIKNKGAEPVIHHVKASFKKAGYSFDYKLLDSRDYLLPQRRNRCWMWAFKGKTRKQQEAAEAAADSVVGLASDVSFSLGQLFRMAKCTKVEKIPKTGLKRMLTRRQHTVVAKCLRQLDPDQRNKEVCVDVAKSLERAVSCVGATSCIVPNSQPYRVKTKTILSPEQVHACQGIFKEDMPALSRWANDKRGLTRDLAGNAFSTTVCMAVAISCLASAPLSGGCPTEVQVIKRKRPTQAQASQAKRVRRVR